MVIGASVKRKEDPRLLTGRGAYVADIRMPGMLHATVVRSPHAHAVIARIDASRAAQTEGVALAAAAADLGAVPQIPVRLGPRPSLRPYLQPVLASDRVRYVGEPVALVIAADRYAAEDAADLVEVDYEPLPAVADVDESLRDGAPRLHASAGGNLAEVLSVEVGDPERAVAGAPVRIRERFAVQRHMAVPMETRGLLAAYDARSGSLTVWGPTKVPHFNRRVLAQLLGWPEERIRFVEPEVGGGFGARGEFYPEDFLIPWAAIRLERPVQWIEDRREHLMAANHSRQQVHDLEIAADADGRVVALVDRITADMGAYMRTHGVIVPELTVALLPGPYDIPHYRCDARCVMTNKTPTGTYRAPGRYEATFVRERMMDMLAEAVGVDAVEIRRRNLIPPAAMPYRCGTEALGVPTVYDTGDYASALDKALAAVRYEAWRGRQRDIRTARGVPDGEEAWGTGRCIGIGIACVVEKAGLGPWETARVEIEPSGRAVVYTGLTSLGQGVETALAQICADTLGFASIDPITVVHGDTDAIAQGIGSFASRGAAVGGSAVLLAARRVREQAFDLAAARLEAPHDDLVITDGRIHVRGTPARTVTLAELASTGAQGLRAEDVFEVSKMTYPYGTHAAVVEVDRETGQVRLLDYAIAYDVGRAINPRLVEGQLVGGLAQGIGGALLEDLVYDPEGQPLAVSFMDYLLPTAAEMPERLAVTILEETPTPHNPLGVKGAGEGGTAGAGAAIANAVADALQLDGVRITSLPLTPDRVVASLERAAAARPAG